MKKKVFVSSGYQGYISWLEEIGFERTLVLEKADLLMLAGGNDIQPKLYGEKEGKWTYTNPKRDAKEVAQYDYAVTHGIKIWGTCRGAQLITALVGGKLIQDVTNHAGNRHDVQMADGDEIYMNSIHHQMCNPYVLPKEDYEVLGWSKRNYSTHYLGQDDKECIIGKFKDFREPEFISYPKVKALAIQGHPEMLGDGKALDKCKELLNKYLFNNELEITKKVRARERHMFDY